jgi:hypothetical protein
MSLDLNRHHTKEDIQMANEKMFHTVYMNPFHLGNAN